MKHLENSHGGRDQVKTVGDHFDNEILKAYRKAFTKYIEEGNYIASHQYLKYGFCLVLDLHWGGSDTDGASPLM